MTRSKRGQTAARGGTPRGGMRGRGRGRGRGPASGPFDQASSHTGFVGFTLADVARQTSRQDHSTWSENVSLRNKPIAFVSGGAIEPLKQLEELLSNVHLDDRNSLPPGELLGSLHLDDHGESPHPTSAVSDVVESTLVFDDAKTDSSEIIGPEELEREIVSAQQPQGQQGDSVFFYDTSRNVPLPLQASSNAALSPKPLSPSSDTASEEEEILFKGRDSHICRTSSLDSQAEPAPTQEREKMLQMSPLKSRNKGKHKAVPREKRSKKRSAIVRQPEENEHEEAMLADYIQNMKDSGDMDVFLQYQNHNKRDLGGTDSDGTSGIMDFKKHEEAESPNALGQIPAGKVETLASENEIDDATLAQLFAEKDLAFNLNLCSYSIDHSDTTDSDEPSTQMNQRKANRAHGIGDPYEDFDPMDWERPSLRKKRGKGATARLPIQVSDSELEARLQTAWKNDRLKKSERKKRREELRALGLLGKNANPDNPAIKYPDGMSIEQVAEEMRDFLMRCDQSLTLPPMDKHARRVIHEMANKLKLQSKSTGKGDERRPTLYRTKRTPPYNSATFDAITSRVHRKYLPRPDKKGPKGPKLGPTGRASMAAANIAEGEIVGGTAPELGIENRGRNMLEKMGWSTGTALGATHNKGILQPVTQAMKKSKAGLG